MRGLSARRINMNNGLFSINDASDVREGALDPRMRRERERQQARSDKERHRHDLSGSETSANCVQVRCHTRACRLSAMPMSCV
jgi:hypothetical protein